MKNSIHEKKIEVPIYGGFINIVIVNDWKYINKTFGCDYTKNTEGTVAYMVKELHPVEFYIVFNGKPYPSLIVHECVHLVNTIFRYRGVLLDRENDETQAYFTEWCFAEVEKFVEEHYG